MEVEGLIGVWIFWICRGVEIDEDRFSLAKLDYMDLVGALVIGQEKMLLTCTQLQSRAV